MGTQAEQTSPESLAESAQAATRPASAARDRYLAVLDAPQRDLDGATQLAGTRVWRNPLAPQDFREATEQQWQRFAALGYAWTADVRGRTWLPKLAEAPAQVLAGIEQRAGLACEFVGKLDKNLSEVAGQGFPLQRRLGRFLLIPMYPVIRSVGLGVDITDKLVEALIKDSGLPADCPLTDEYRQLLRRCNAMRVYELRGSLGVRVHAVVAWVSPVRLRPLDWMELGPLDARVLGTIDRVYSDWRNGDGYVGVPHAVYRSIGALDTTPDTRPGVCAEGQTVLATLVPGSDAKPSDAWAFHRAVQLALPAAVRGFVDRLRPETRQDRAKRIADLVKERKISGATADIEWLATRTQYRRGLVREAMFDLQEESQYKVDRNARGLLFIAAREPADQSIGIVRRSRKSRAVYHLKQIGVASVATIVTIVGAWGMRRFSGGLIAVGLPAMWLAALANCYLRQRPNEMDSGDD